MSKQATRKPLSIALGAAIVTTLGAAGIANANETGADLFSMQELTSGYLTAGGHETDGDEKEAKKAAVALKTAVKVAVAMTKRKTAKVNVVKANAVVTARNRRFDHV